MQIFRNSVWVCRRRVISNLFVALLGGSAALLAGCGMGMASPAPASVSLHSMQGRVFGGQQPVAQATVQLYAAGTTGYDSAATPLINAGTVTGGATYPILTDGSGSFTISGDFSCPIPSSTPVYLTVTGGNPAPGITNPNIALMAALGPCSGLSGISFVNVNEVTTAASVYALAPFMSATFGTIGAESIATSSTNLVGLQNAFTTVNNLVNIGSGSSPGPDVPLGAVIPTALINSLANSLASCINSDGTGCTDAGKLFPAVTPSGGTQPADTIQAALYVVQNPGNNVTAIFNLGTGVAAQFAGLSGAPNDWTAEIAYNGIVSDGNGGTTGGLNVPFIPATDSQGEVWVINNPIISQQGAISSSNPANFMALLSNNGTPLSGVSGYANTADYPNFSLPRGVAVDLDDNVWIANDSTIAGKSTTGPANSNVVFKITSTGTVSSIQTGTTVGATTSLEQPYPLAVDKSNNVWIASTTTKTVGEIAKGASVATYPATGKSVTGATPSALALDTNGNIWVTGTATTASGGGVSYIVNPLNGLSSAGTSTLLTGSIFTPYGLAIDSSNNAWVSNESSSPVNVVNMDSTGTILHTCSGGGMTTPRYIALDGAGHLWVANASTPGFAVEFSATCTVLSGTAGYGAGNANLASLLATTRGIAIDNAGSVWLTNNKTGLTTGSTTVVEIVGAAAPTASLAQALKNGKVGQQP